MWLCNKVNNKAINKIIQLKKLIKKMLIKFKEQQIKENAED